MHFGTETLIRVMALKKGDHVIKHKGSIVYWKLFSCLTAPCEKDEWKKEEFRHSWSSLVLF